jgi:type II secretory ATPase GspE/PulE/Tfp pilus assembly ATPase PilB-like protein
MTDKLVPRIHSAPLSAFKRIAPKIENSEASSENDESSARTLSRCSSHEARKLLSYEAALKLKVLPLGIITLMEGQVLTVAAPSLHDADLVHSLRFATGHQIKLIPAKSTALMKAIHFAYCGSEEALATSVEKISRETSPSRSDKPFIPEFRPAQGDIAQLLAALIDYAITRNASDLHLIPLHDGGHVRMRVKGELFCHESSFCTLENHAKIISRLKVLAALDVTQRAQPQDGSFTIPIQREEVFARLSVMPTVHGEKAVIRLMNSTGLLELKDLGLSSTASELLLHSASKSEGAILFAGPTGSGKTTTMYALLQFLAARNLSVVSIEDPVEIQIAGVSQTSVDERRELSYAACLRSILRQDPDVILLGEMRDEESAKIAFQAALTGHLLLSTVHARSCAETILRLRALNADMLSVAQSVRLIVCQRLIPTLCSRCKVVDLSRNGKFEFEIYQAVGCVECDYSGFSGRQLVIEMLEMHPELYELLVKCSYERLSTTVFPLRHYIPLSSGLEKLLREGSIQFKDYSEFL